jgi:site-specific DNA-cytosine methylase
MRSEQIKQWLKDNELSHQKVAERIGYARVSVTRVLARFWQAVADRQAEADTHMAFRNVQVPKAQAAALRQAFGSRAVVATDAVTQREAEYRGLKPVHLQWGLEETAKEIIGTDREELAALSGRASTLYPKSRLSAAQRRVLDLVRRLSQRAGIQQWLLATPAVVAMRNVDGADRFKTTGADQPLSTQVTAIQHGLLAVPFLAQLRNHQTAIGVDEPLGTLTAGGVHHALVMSYYSHSVPQPVEEALPTVTTVDRHSLIVSPQRPALEDCLFRMLTAAECKLAQSFPRDYVILGSQRDQVRQIGNANPPVLMDALLARVAPIVE